MTNLSGSFFISFKENDALIINILIVKTLDKIIFLNLWSKFNWWHLSVGEKILTLNIKKSFPFQLKLIAIRISRPFGPHILVAFNYIHG